MKGRNIDREKEGKRNHSYKKKLFKETERHRERERQRQSEIQELSHRESERKKSLNYKKKTFLRDRDR